VGTGDGSKEGHPDLSENLRLKKKLGRAEFLHANWREILCPEIWKTHRLQTRRRCAVDHRVNGGA